MYLSWKCILGPAGLLVEMHMLLIISLSFFIPWILFPSTWHLAHAGCALPIMRAPGGSMFYLLVLSFPLHMMMSCGMLFAELCLLDIGGLHCMLASRCFIGVCHIFCYLQTYSDSWGISGLWFCELIYTLTTIWAPWMSVPGWVYHLTLSVG